jgi:arginine-tRNA-protein transferase
MSLSDRQLYEVESSLYLMHQRLVCSYLPDRIASLLYLNGDLDAKAYRQLLDAGYRRTGDKLYRTDCPGCEECRVIRIPIATFSMTGSQRRVWKKGQRIFTCTLQKPEYSPKKLRMYRRYLLYQHQRYESDLDEDGYESFFVSSFLGDHTRELLLFHNGRLAGLSIIDIVEDVLSSVYFFFDPDVARYSPGVYSMLLEIDLARQMGLSYYYPGYYIKDCPEMNYKARYGPAEILCNGRFVPFER